MIALRCEWRSGIANESNSAVLVVVPSGELLDGPVYIKAIV